VLFNEPKLLKLRCASHCDGMTYHFSALQRAEIAETQPEYAPGDKTPKFQCSSTSRNC